MPKVNGREIAPREAEKTKSALTAGLTGGPVRGFEDDDKEDLILPRVTLLQGLSPEIMNPEEGSDLKVGMIINSLSKEALPSEFIPILKWKEWLQFKTKEEGGGLIWKSLDPKDPRVIDGIQWKDGKKPAVTTVMNFLCVFLGELDKPVILSFRDTSYRTGKLLLSLAKFKNTDMFGYHYKLMSKKMQNEKGIFYVFDVHQLGASSTEEIAACVSLYEAFHHKKTEIKVDQGTEAPYKDPGDDSVPF